ncbi:MAG: hypothetical protein V9G23_04125 [Giesbergeria sp.]
MAVVEGGVTTARSDPRGSTLATHRVLRNPYALLSMALLFSACRRRG